MSSSIKLTPEQEARLQAEADARSTNIQTLVSEWVNSLPATDQATRPRSGKTPGARGGSNGRRTRLSGTAKMTPRDILAYWAEDQTPSVYARTGEDASTIARRLRPEAERRGPRQ
jgi:hypothetical protein